MIAFSKLGKYGRLGNQLFQYAYLRSEAKRLGVKFYCPQWLGDTIFDLKDEDERAGECVADKAYVEDRRNPGFNSSALEIKDGTDVLGYFQTEKYFISPKEVHKWFSFRRDKFLELEKKYANIDFSKSVAIHLRLGDYKKSIPIYYIPKRSFFRKALAIVDHGDNILVFSDNIPAAQKYLGNIKGNFIYIQGNSDFEDLYLMIKCADIICSASSFSWWAAYLNDSDDRTVVVPERWLAPGSHIQNKDIFPSKWVKIRAHRFLLDNFNLRMPAYFLKKVAERFNDRIYKVAKDVGVYVVIRNVVRKIFSKINTSIKIVFGNLYFSNTSLKQNQRSFQKHLTSQ